jgi:hypothetical protein
VGLRQTQRPGRAKNPGGVELDRLAGEQCLRDQYYDDAGRLRFALVFVYAANGSRDQHRVYFDETGKPIWQSRKNVKGPGYFAPNNVEEFAKDDVAKEFENAPIEGCKEIEAKAKRSAK